MKQSRFIQLLLILLSPALLVMPAKGQSAKGYLEGSVLVPAGGFTQHASGSVEQSVGQIAYTTVEMAKFTLEQGVLHAFFLKGQDEQPNDDNSSPTPVEFAQIACNIYPNPCASILNIEVAGTDSQIHYRVLSSTGAEFLSGQFSGTHYKLAAHTLPTGLYLLVLEQRDGKRSVKRFVKE